MENLLRVLTASPRVHIGNVTKNCDEIKSIYKEYAAIVKTFLFRIYLHTSAFLYPQEIALLRFFRP